MSKKKDNGDADSANAEPVRDLHNEKSKEFHKILIIVLGSALFFFVVFLMPYAIVKGDLNSVVDLIETKKESIAYLEDFSKLYNSMDSLVGRLEADLRRPEPVEGHRSISLNDNTLIGLQLGDANTTAALKAAVSKQFNEYGTEIQRIDSRVENITKKIYLMDKIVDITDEDVKRSIKISIRELNQTDIPRLQERYKSLNASVLNALSADPSPVTVVNPLTVNDSVVDDDIRMLYTLAQQECVRTAEYLELLDEPMANVTRDIGELSRYRDALVNKTQIIRDSLASYQSPLGTIPVGIDEAMVLFPVAISLGFLVCVRLLKEQVKLREVARYKPRKVDPATAALFEPLWIDPETPHQTQAVQLAIFLVPLVVSVVAIGYNFQMLSFEEMPLASLAQQDFIERWHFQFVLGVLSIFGFALGVFFVIREIHNYREWLVAKAATASPGSRGRRRSGRRRGSRRIKNSY